MRDSELSMLLGFLKSLHFAIFDAVREKMLSAEDAQSSVVLDGAGDLSYPIDIASEDIIHSFFMNNSLEGGAVVISEGLGKKVYPSSMDEGLVAFRILIDPIDGTRELMYDKRSAWVITAVAPNMGEATSLADVCLSIQTELPVLKQEISSVIYAWKNGGAWEERWHIKERKMVSLAKQLIPSKSDNLLHGYAVFTNYFPGTRAVVSAFADKVIARCGIRNVEGKSYVFDDQYISSGGQLYLLASGAYRFVADIRPYLSSFSERSNSGQVLCCHPYDIGGLLLLTEAGGIMTDLSGQEIRYPLDTETSCGWLAYANEDLRRILEPIVLRELNEMAAGI